MRVGIMQPYFFPYLGYFQLIHQCDRFILFDDVQYIRHGWINRNRVLKPNEGWQYILAPLKKHNQSDLIRSIDIQDGDEWKLKIVRQLEHYKKKARYYEETMALVGRCFQSGELSITQFNATTLQLICEELGIRFTKEISSEMNFDYSEVSDAGEWALRICEQIGAKEYMNPPGGRELFDVSKFERSGIRLSFLTPVLREYDQRRAGFEAGLSIIDVLMFNGLKGTMEMVRSANSNQ